jgi:hypothetical protein
MPPLKTTVFEQLESPFSIAWIQRVAEELGRGFLEQAPALAASVIMHASKHRLSLDPPKAHLMLEFTLDNDVRID